MQFLYDVVRSNLTLSKQTAKKNLGVSILILGGLCGLAVIMIPY